VISDTGLNLSSEQMYYGEIIRNYGKKNIASLDVPFLFPYVLFFVLLFFTYLLFTSSSFADDVPVVIKGIEIEGLTRIEREEFMDIISLNEGDSFDSEALKAGIRRAFKKKIFLDIVTSAEPYNEGIKLKYLVKEVPVVKKVKIKGNKKISKRQIKKVLLFKEDENILEDLIDMAEKDLKKYYARKGYPNAKVNITAERDRGTGKIILHLLIQEENPVYIQSISTLPEARRRLRIDEGDIFDADRIEKDMGRLRKYYRKKKYIKPVIGPYDFKDGKLVIPVTHGPRLEIVFKGNKSISSKKLSRKVAFLEGEEVTADLLRESVDTIEKYYYQKGYYSAQVSGGIEEEENLLRVVFFIFEGEKIILREIVFKNITLSSESIKNIIPLNEGKVYDKNLLIESKESIVAFYNALGYLNADVMEVQEDIFKDGKELRLSFTIDEGSQVTIKEIAITGSRIISSDEIRNVLLIKENAPYNQNDINDARQRIVSLYKRLGYIDAEVRVKGTIDKETASLVFDIVENDPFVFGKIVVSGNWKTKNEVIRREFEIREGDPFNIDAISRTRQRLYKLGLFDSVSIEPIETSDIKSHVEAYEEVHVQDVLVELTEGNPGAVEISLGYGDYDRFRGSLDISYNNLGGYHRKISFRTELSSVEERYKLTFTEPWLFNKPAMPFNISLIKEKTESIDIDTRDVRYKVDRWAFLAGVDKEFTERLKGNLKYEYSRVETTDVDPGVILSKEDVGTLGISSISPSLFHDTRDNPFDPTSGSLKGIIVKLASSLLLSESEFIKAILKSSWYSSLRKGLVFAFSLQGGIAQGFGDTDELPVVERFFLGGRTTVRGFDQDEVGPKGEDDTPTGGNVFTQANAEFRIALRKGFGMVTFIDVGNVWQKIEDVGTKLRYTAGLGLRYETPVGPFRIDYGHKLNKEKGESEGELHFSFGQAF
jgi:outer membrane protein insertion porin family